MGASCRLGTDKYFSNGSNVSFTPNASSAGVLTATINLPCGYKETRTFNVTRVAEAPTFSSTSPVSSCASSATISINPTCGASSYTYTIIGSAGVKFGNGLQTLTTTSTSATLSLSGSPSSNTVKAKSNYVNNNVSSEATTPFNYGAVAPGPISVHIVDPDIGRIQVTIEPVVGATSYNWYKNGVLHNTHHGTFAQIPITIGRCDISYDISVEAISACGTSLKSHKDVYVPPCDNYAMSPNPATSTVEVSNTDYSSEKDVASNSTNSKETIYKIWIVDKMGTIMRQFNYATPLQKAYIDISGLKADTYLLKIYNGKNWIIKKLIKV